MLRRRTGQKVHCEERGTPLAWCLECIAEFTLWIFESRVCGERLKARGVRRWGWQRVRWSDSITNSVDMTLSKLRETVKDRGAWWAVVRGVAKSWMWLSDWTTTINIYTNSVILILKSEADIQVGNFQITYLILDRSISFTQYGHHLNRKSGFFMDLNYKNNFWFEKWD